MSNRTLRYRLLLCLVLAGPAATPADEGGDGSELVIGGSGTNLGAVKHLAQSFSRERQVPVRVLPSIGSGGSVKALLMMDIDLGLSSRALRPDELARGLRQRLYAQTPLVIAAHRDVPVTGITRDQLQQIYQGQLKEWRSGLPVRLILRPRADSDTQALMSLLPGMRAALESAYTGGRVIAYTDQENADMLEQIEGSIGTSSLGLILSEQRRIRPLALAGVEPSAAALASGQYPLSKTLYFVLPAQPHAQALAFVDYVFEQGADYLRATGHLLHARPD